MFSSSVLLNFFYKKSCKHEFGRLRLFEICTNGPHPMSFAPEVQRLSHTPRAQGWQKCTWTEGGGVQILVDRGGMRAYKYHCIGFVSHFVNWLLLIAKNSFLELFLDPPHVQNQPACDNLPLPGLEKSIPNRFCSIVRHHAYHEFQRKHTVILANFI